MPCSELELASGGLGLGTICQLVPSQRSATVVDLNTLNAGVNVALPTAMHELADEQSTALRKVSSAPATFGVGVTVQAAEASGGREQERGNREQDQTKRSKRHLPR